MGDRKTLLNFIFGLVCTAAVSVSVPLLLYHAFELTADPGAVFLLCTVFSVLYSLAFSGKKTSAAAAVTLFGVLLLLWNRKAALDSSLLLAKSISDVLLNSFESFSHLESKLAVDSAASCSCVLAGIGCGTAALTSVGIFSKKHSRLGVELLPSALVSAIVLLLCTVQSVNQVPAGPVALFCGTWALLFMTQRCQAADRGFWQWLILPAAAFAILCLVLILPFKGSRELVSSYTSQWQDFIYDYSPIKATEDGVRIVTPLASQSLGNTPWNKHLNQADLARVGPNPYSETQVMSVRSDSPGYVYLRGSSLGVYDGIAWRAIPQEKYNGVILDDGLFVKDGDTGSAQLTVRTEHDCQIAYVPTILTSMPDQMVPHLDNYLSNPERLTSYSMDIHPLRSTQMLKNYAIPEGYDEFVHENYLQIPESASEYLAGYYKAPENAGLSDILRSVCEKLADDKSYDRQTKRMTRGSGDFVVWFLSQSETGYCIHFASAAVMMLRNCGIPARLVTGYLAYMDTDRWNIVKQGDAHAWVEYYVDGAGWYTLDPTPVDGSGEGLGLYVPAASGGTQAAGTVKISSEPSPAVRGTPPVRVQQPDHKARRVILICLAVLYILWFFGLKIYRSVQFRNKDLNKRVLAIYHWIVLISKVDGVLPPEDAKDIALKARFSKEGADAKDAEKILGIYNVTCERMHIYSEFWRAFAANYLLAI